MRDVGIFKLPEENLNEGIQLMLVFLNETNKHLKLLDAVDLRNVEKPVVKFRSPLSIYTGNQKKGRLAS